MNRRSQRRYTVGEYFATEQGSEIKHEYYDGEIFAMAGASVNHNGIVRNLLSILQSALQGSPCEALGSDLRVYTPAGLYTYPDVMVVCGAIELVEAPLDTVANPAALVEVLSDSTSEYDRGEKFTLYKSIPALADYVLIEQVKARVDHFTKGADGAWRLSSYSDLNGQVQLAGVPAALPLAGVYNRVFDG